MKVQVVNMIKGIKYMRYKYTDEDIEFLKEYYPKRDWDSIFKRFPILGKDQIYNICHKRGIHADGNSRSQEDCVKSAANRRKWTPEEDFILINNYENIPLTEICNLLPNRSYNAIVIHAQKLNLISYNKTKQLYTEDEIEFIKNNWHTMSDEEIAQKLHRTARAIKATRNNLKLFKQDKNHCHYENLLKFLRGQITQWKKASMEACNYECMITKSKDFEIHHLISFNTIVKEFIDEYNIETKETFEDYSNDELSFIAKSFIEKHNKYPLGVCVEENLHNLFHHIYGDINDEFQWNDFVEKINKGQISY